MPPTQNVPTGSVPQGNGSIAGFAMMARVPTWLSALPRSLWAKPKDAFIYSANFPTLGAAGSATATQSLPVQIQSDSDFIIQSIQRIATDSATGNTFFDRVPVTILLTDTGAGRQLFDGPVHIEALAGDGQNNGWDPFPKRMGASSSLNVQVTNLGSVGLNLRVYFAGFKIFGNMADEQ